MKKVLLVLACCLLVLAPAGCRTDAGSLAGSEWELKSYGPVDSQTTLLDGTRITLVFNPKGNGISGFSGCNTYGGECSIQQDQISFSNIYQTEMACTNPPGIMIQETAYLNLLHLSQTYKITTGELAIFAGNNRLLFVAVN